MKKVLISLFLVLFYASSLFSNQEKIKIAIPYAMTPYAFTEDGSSANGILIDYWKLWAKKNNKEIEFVPYDWKGTLDAIKNKKVDIHVGLFKNEERAKFLDYVEPIYRSQSHIYFNKDLHQEIKTINDISYRTIGIEDGSYYDSYLQKNYPKVKIKRFRTFDDMFKALKNKEIDLLIEDSLIIQRYLMKDASFNKVSILPNFELNTWFHAAVKKDDTPLLKMVREGFNKITQNELRVLEKKWVVKDNFKFFGNASQKNQPLNNNHALIDKKTITLALVKDWIRYSYIDIDGKLKGFHLDLINQINENLNTNIQYHLFENWTQAYKNAKEGKVDGILGLSWSEERETFFNYSPSYHYSPYHIVTNVANNDIFSLSDFNNKTAATHEHSITNKIITSEAPNTNIIHKNSIKGIIEAVSTNEVDAAILENAEELDLKRHHLKIVDSVYTKYSELSIGITKNKKEIHSLITKGIESISKEQMKLLKDKWFKKKIVFNKDELNYIKNTPELIVGIEDWPGVISSPDQKTIEGLSGEIVQKAFKISGLKLTYVFGTWNDLLNDFKKGKIDLLPATAYTKQRDEYGDYSNKYLSMKNYIYVKSGNETITSLEDLRHKKLALQKGFNTITLIKERYPDIQIIETDSLEESIQKVLNGEVDALFELQIAVQNKMKEQLITNLKAIAQNSIKTQSLHIFFTKGDTILESILNKSLALIPHNEKNRIISKWLYNFNTTKNVNVAFGLGRDPYILDKNFMKGIEYDLVNKILNLSSIHIKNKKNISVENLKNIFNTDKNIDIAVSIKEDKNSGLFYSDNFMEFQNIAVSRKSDQLQINSVKDLVKLKDKKIVGFLDAYKYLGEDYYNLYNLDNRPETYSEISFQREQVKDFFNKQTDIIVLDKNIFKWFFNELNETDFSKYEMHYIFPNNNIYKVAFKDKNLRDTFNKNLQHIKETGEYEAIVNNYAKGYITSKVKINSLISLTAGHYIFENNIKELNQLIEVFTQLPYINKIEVFDTNNEVLVRNIQKETKNFILTDTYHFIDNLPQKVGFIKVYFDNMLLKKYEDSPIFIPHINKFEQFEFFDFIKETYRKLEYINNDIEFTQQELDFINTKKVITFSNVNWAPMSMVHNNEITGLFYEYVKLIEEKTGLKFQFIPSKSWTEVLQKFRDGKLDVVPNIGEAAYSFENGIVSDSVVNFKYAIVSNKKGTYLDGLKELKGKTIALPVGFSTNVLIKNNYPDVKIVPAQSVKDALKMVSKNEVDAFVGHSAISIYSIQNDFPDLKVIGLSDEVYKHYILMQAKYPELLTILNKAIQSISPKEREEIKNKWITTEVSTAIDYAIVYRLLAFFLLVLGIVLFFTRKLSVAKELIENRNKKIEETLIDLEEQKNIFETLFNDTTDGLLLLKDGKFIDCNNAVLKILGFENKTVLLNAKPHEISPQYQEDGQKSSEKEKLLINECLDKGSSRFEWLHKKANGEIFWVEVVLTKIILNNEDVIHVVWRDIEDKKILEKQILDRNLELEDSNHELEVSLDNLKQTQKQLIESEKMASLGGLVAGVAHEVNTPIGIGLTGATHFIEISSEIKKSYQNEKMTQESFENYLATSDELAHLITNNLQKAANLVKSFKQVAVDQTSEERRTFNIKTYFDEVLTNMHSVLKKTNIHIDVICVDNIEINSYPGAFSQILTNLIMNSLIHGYEKNAHGNITIEVIKNNSRIQIIYTDDGKGIKEENIGKIFDPFFTTNREKGGSGLGLNIIYNLVTSKLKGEIKYLENNKQGVAFELLFNV